MWNMVFVQCVILVLAFPAFEEDVGDMGARLGINLTMLLTAMGFKSYLSDQLPKVPYLTTMEWCVR